MLTRAYRAAWLFDGKELRKDCALLVGHGVVKGLVATRDIPAGTTVQDLGKGTITPGFVDLQVNGGDGIMFNDDPSVAPLRRIAAAHGRLGTTALLPTLITDKPAQTAAAIEAVVEAISLGVPGIAGLHLEGPHLSLARKGAHDPALIRPMDRADLDLLCTAAARLPALMVTVAAETVRPDQIAEMAAAGIIVSLGHSDADFDTCKLAVESGARCATHLFNAMSQLGNRQPGLVGAVLDMPRLNAGLIADGIHVHPVSIASALRAKKGPGAVFLVTDAMAPAGSDITSFTLQGRRITRIDGRLTLSDGTLAGADVDMARALQVLTGTVGIPADQALAMATRIPAHLIGQYRAIGALQPGGRADFAYLEPDLTLGGSWVGGARQGDARKP